MAVIQISATDNFARFNFASDVETIVEVSAAGNSDWYISPNGFTITPNGAIDLKARSILVSV